MRPENWPPHLRTVSDKLQGVTLKSEDFESVIDSLSDGYFIFVDPPYFDADQHKLYTCTFERGGSSEIGRMPAPELRPVAIPIDLR